MAKISTNDLRAGMVVRLEGENYLVIDAQHYKPGKGQAFVRTKLKNLRTGQFFERNLPAETEVERPFVERRKAQFLYQQGDQLVFMDEELYEQYELSAEAVGENVDLLKEGAQVELLFLDGELTGAELPTFVELEVVDAPPGVKGDTVSGGTKWVTVETGARIQVPLFIKKGDRIRIDTRTREYVERV